MQQLCDDLVAEHRDLDEVVAVADLDVPTPAPGWSVGDQISHLWFFDQRAVLALTDGEAFAADAAALGEALTNGADPSVALGRALGKGELVRRWRADRGRLVDVARTVDPATRVPWYGPAMGARSFVTARLMETWAHGQDVADGLGVTRTPTDRLRHVAHLGVRRPPVQLRRQRAPDPPRSRCTCASTRRPGRCGSGDRRDADDRVTGTALDFCLVVTRRRHVDDVDLTIVGAEATRWMAMAQVFAGPPGEGRAAGQFRSTDRP